MIGMGQDSLSHTRHRLCDNARYTSRIPVHMDFPALFRLYFPPKCQNEVSPGLSGAVLWLYPIVFVPEFT